MSNKATPNKQCTILHIYVRRICITVDVLVSAQLRGLGAGPGSREYGRPYVTEEFPDQ
jgi:hypothetical protein